MTLHLRNARLWGDGRPCDVAVAAGWVVDRQQTRRGEGIDLEGRALLPGLVNGHDHLGFSTFPPLGRPPYASVYEWAAAVDRGAGDPGARAALSVPLADRLFLGGLRNLLCGVTAVAHHDPRHRSLGSSGFPVRVLLKYGHAHSAGLSPRFRESHRRTGAQVPWMIHAAEGTDNRCRGELDLLEAAGVLRTNTVLVHALGLRAEDAPRIAAAGASVVWCPAANRFLYAAAAPVAALLAAGVRIGLGSDSPVSGVRDPLANLAAARREDVFTDAELVALATRGSADALRLPVGGFTPGSFADFIAVDDVGRLLSGDRTAVALVVVRGRPAYGAPSLMPSAGCVTLRVDGAERVLEGETGRRAAAIHRRHPEARRSPWMGGVEFE